jgi:signal transduction histidine kinase
LGLASIVNKKALDDENNLFLDKIVEVSKDLDLIIHDLNLVLAVQKGLDQEYILASFEGKVNKVLHRLENKIEEQKATIIFDFSAAPEVKTIVVYFESILYNLISNSIKYGKPGVPPQITLTTEDTGKYILLIITDNGIGVDTERFKDKLFGLYKRFHTHVDGKGLGLYMVKTQLEAMGGKIELESKPNVGSTFRVYFKK